MPKNIEHSVCAPPHAETLIAWAYSTSLLVVFVTSSFVLWRCGRCCAESTQQQASVRRSYKGVSVTSVMLGKLGSTSPTSNSQAWAPQEGNPA